MPSRSAIGAKAEPGGDVKRQDSNATQEAQEALGDQMEHLAGQMLFTAWAEEVDTHLARGRYGRSDMYRGYLP